MESDGAAGAGENTDFEAVPGSKARWFERFKMALLDDATFRLQELASVPTETLAEALARGLTPTDASPPASSRKSGGLSGEVFQVPWSDLEQHQLTHEQTRLAGGQVR